MKKIEYLAPEMELIDVRLSTILCVSPGSGESQTVDPSDEPGGNEPRF